MTALIRKLHFFVAASLVIPLATPASAEIELGNVTLGTRPSAPIRPDARFRVGGASRAIRSGAFVRRVGGVAFGAVAEPRTKIANLSLRYDKRRPDGERVTITIDGETAPFAVPDWILQPSIGIAEKESIELVTAFGNYKKKGATPEELCKNYIFSYHPALENTIAGLRVVQADLIGIMGSQYSELPMARGVYILGATEVAPTTVQVRERSRNHAATMSTMAGKYQSYVMTDADVPISFGIEDGELGFEGKPVYQLWKPKSDTSSTPGEFAKTYADEFVQLGRTRAWAITRANELTAAIRRTLSETPSTVESRRLLKMVGDLVRSLPVTQDLADVGLAVGILEYFAAEEVTLLGSDENPLLNEEVISRANPVVYDAVSAIARTVAFLRYVKRSHPKAWKVLVASKKAMVNPRVDTITEVPRGEQSEAQCLQRIRARTSR